MSDSSVAASPVRVEESVELLLADAEDRRPWKAVDSLSGSRFERVTVDGVPMVVKYLSVDDDWIMRATGDLNCRQLTLLESGVLAALPATIDDTVVACAPFTTVSGRRGAALLLRDVSDGMVPPGGAVLALEQHRSFLEHMADLHAAYWGFRDRIGLFPLAHAFVFLTADMAELEARSPHSDPVPPAVARGWALLDARFPVEGRALRALAHDPTPLVDALVRGPQTLVHGDWKLGNLGSHPDGRTILIDWDRCGAGPPLVDLAWYLAINCDRLPECKEDAILAYRSYLEGHGIGTASWWEAQLAAALAGAFLQLGWEKVDSVDEFRWWSERLADWSA